MPLKELTAALDAAQAAAEGIRGFSRSSAAVRMNPDASPVTEADLRAEEAIRTILAGRFPGYGFFGEETGRHAMGAESIWLVDPIDGTKSFVREAPFFSTQTALMRAGALVLGGSTAPAYEELAWAERGGGAYLDGERIHVSEVAALADAFTSIGNVKTLPRPPHW